MRNIRNRPPKPPLSEYNEKSGMHTDCTVGVTVFAKVMRVCVCVCLQLKCSISASMHIKNQVCSMSVQLWHAKMHIAVPCRVLHYGMVPAYTQTHTYAYVQTCIGQS